MYRVTLQDKQHREGNCTLDASLPEAADIIVAMATYLIPMFLHKQI